VFVFELSVSKNAQVVVPEFIEDTVFVEFEKLPYPPPMPG
jgi:hypothetical protein